MSLSTQLMTDAVVAQYIHDISTDRRPGEETGAPGPAALVEAGAALERPYNAARTRL